MATTRLHHLFKGVILYTVYMVLCAMVSSLMRFAAPLMPSQAYALIFVGEVISLVPFSVTAKNNWSLKTKTEGIAFSVWSCVLACSYVWLIYCTKNMPLGLSFVEFCGGSCFGLFLVTCTRLYNLLCPSVGWSPLHFFSHGFAVFGLTAPAKML